MIAVVSTACTSSITLTGSRRSAKSRLRRSQTHLSYSVSPDRDTMRLGTQILSSSIAKIRPRFSGGTLKAVLACETPNCSQKGTEKSRRLRWSQKEDDTDWKTQ